MQESIVWALTEEAPEWFTAGAGAGEFTIG